MGANQKIKAFFKRNLKISIIIGVLLLTAVIILGYFLFKPHEGDSTDSDDNSTNGDDSTGDSTGTDTSDGNTSASNTSASNTSASNTSAANTNPANTNGGDSNGGDSNGSDSNGGDSNGGDANGGDSNGGDIPLGMMDHWNPKLYSIMKDDILRQTPELKSQPVLLNCIVNNIVKSYKNPQTIETDTHLSQTIFNIVESCKSGDMKDPGKPNFGLPNAKPNAKPNNPDTTGIAKDIFKNCQSSARKGQPFNCDNSIMDCARKQPACLHDNNCLSDVANLVQNYCTQIHGKKLPIKPPSSDSSGFYSYCDEKCKCVKTKGEHPAGHDLYSDPICSGDCKGAKCKPLHSIKHGVF